MCAVYVEPQVGAGSPISEKNNLVGVIRTYICTDTYIYIYIYDIYIRAI